MVPKSGAPQCSRAGGQNSKTGSKEKMLCLWKTNVFQVQPCEILSGLRKENPQAEGGNPTAQLLPALTHLECKKAARRNGFLTRF